jgi:hypothetical protein
VQSIDFDALSGDYGVYFGLNEILGVETVSGQGSTQLNNVTLMNSGGWISKSASLSEWNFQFTGYVPTGLNTGYRLLKQSFLQRTGLYVERHLPNGEVTSGKVALTSFSDQIQGAGYVQYNVTFEGAGIQSFGIKAPTETLPVVTDPPDTPDQPPLEMTGGMAYELDNSENLLSIINF